MRIDLFLKKQGVIKRRSVAKEMIEKGLILVDGKKIKPSFEIKKCIINITFGEKIIDFPVVFDQDNWKIE